MAPPRRPILRFHAAGDWGPGAVRIDRVPATRPVVPEVERQIDAAWAAALARPGVHLFDGPMCRLEHWHVSADGRALSLALSDTSYRPFLGTNLSHPDLADRYGRQVLANPVGVSPSLLTADGFLMMGRRNASVAYYPHRVHPFAGALDPADPDVFAAVNRELEEELSFTPADVADVRCTGIAEDLSIRQPELIFAATSTLTRAAIEARLDDTEHHGVWSAPAARRGLEAALEEALDIHPVGAAATHPVEGFTPVAIASLLLFGRLSLGEEWFAAWSARFT